ncbi:MAG: efflux RND transporter periplasmic adaptor subunit [Thermodesulfovibrio sp.]|nr:efflux RND transporter periplasmic adaptor subunit [Thermodesulfovibrio sp.]
MSFKSRVTSTVLLLFCLLPLAACAKKKPEPPKKPPIPVTVGTATVKSVPVHVKAIGTVEPYATVAIKAQVGGLLSKVHFREGQDVRKGDLLFTIDPRPYEAQIRQYEAVLAKNRALLDNAREEARRYGDLAKKGYVARDQYEQFRTNELALEATVNADKAVLENARLQLGYCSIPAPVSGRTGSLIVNEGNLIKANADTAMVVINQVQPVYVAFSVPERNLSEIRSRMRSGSLSVAVNLSTGDVHAETGKLTFIENTVDPATGTIKLKGAFANRENKLWPGQYVNTTLTLAELANTVVVPTQAVQTGQQGQYVFVVKQDTVELRQVTTGPSFEGETVIEKGVIAGEQVITDGQMRLVPGAKIEILIAGKPGAVPTPNPAPAAGEKK